MGTSAQAGCTLMSSKSWAGVTSVPLLLAVATAMNLRHVVGGLLSTWMESEEDVEEGADGIGWRDPTIALRIRSVTGPWKRRMRLSLVDHRAATAGLASKADIASSDRLGWTMSAILFRRSVP